MPPDRASIACALVVTPGEMKSVGNQYLLANNKMRVLCLVSLKFGGKCKEKKLGKCV